MEPPEEERRDDFLTPYFDRSKPDQVVAIVKAREPARILVAIGNNQSKGYHLEFKRRWVQQYNFYLNDRNWGRMCPYFPFSARICLNQHNWLATRMWELGIRFKQCSNAFTRCSDPVLLQELADSLDPKDIISCAQKWVAALTPFFKKQERSHGGCQHRISFSQFDTATT